MKICFNQNKRKLVLLETHHRTQHLCLVIREIGWTFFLPSAILVNLYSARKIMSTVDKTSPYSICKGYASFWAQSWSESFSIFKITYKYTNIHRGCNSCNSLSNENVPVQSTPTDLSLQLALFRSAVQYPMSDSLPKQPREFTRTGVFPCCDWKNEPPEL